MMKHRLFRWLLVLSLVATSLGIAQPRRAYACSCASTPGLSDVERVLESYNRAHNQIVFVGTPVASVAVQKSEQTVSSDDTVFVTFAVESVYRGNIAPRFTLTTPRDDAMCGAHFVEGTRTLVFAGDEFNDGSWDSNLCAGNVDNPTDAVLAALGEGRVPTEQGERGETAPEQPATAVPETNTALEPSSETNSVKTMPETAGEGSQTSVTRWLMITAVLALIAMAIYRPFAKKGVMLLLLALIIWPIIGCDSSAQPDPAASSAPPSELLDQWVLVAAGDEASDMFLPAQPPQLTFTKDPSSDESDGFLFEGFSGCNVLFGDYRLRNDSVLFMNVGMTEMFCNDGSSEFEQFMVQILLNEPTFSISSEGEDTFLTIQAPNDPAGRLLFRNRLVE